MDSPENIEIFKNLKYDEKEYLTKEEIYTLLEKIFIKNEFNEYDLEFFRSLIDKIKKDLPSMVAMTDVRNYFEMPYITKFVDENPEQQAEENNDENEDNHKKDEI